MEDEKSQLAVLKPTVLSFFGALGVSIFLVTSIVWSVGFKNQTIHSLLLGESYTEIADDLTFEVLVAQDSLANSPLDAVPVAILWMLIGMFVFTLLNGLINSIRTIQQLKQELDHDKSMHDKVMQVELTRVALRTIFLSLWFLYLIAYFRLLVPHWYESARIAALGLDSVYSILFGIWAVFLMTVGLHVHVVFLRLVALKKRLF